MTVRYLDVRGQTWSLIVDKGAAKFINKKDAAAFAKSQGWRVKDVTKAANRFCIYWVITQQQSPASLTFLRSDGGKFDIPFPGFW